MTEMRKHSIAGIIPRDWNAGLIKNYCEVVRGASPRPAGDPRYFNGDALPWITVADVTGTAGMYLLATKSKLTKEGTKHTRIIPPDTLIITNSGATLGVPKITTETAGANDGIAMFLNVDGLSKQFLYYFLESKTEYFRNELAPGVGQPNLNTDLLGGVPIPIPPYKEQEAIAEKVQMWDVAIEKAAKLIEAKEKRFSNLLHSLIHKECRKWPHIRTDQLYQCVSEKDNGHEELLSVTQDRGAVPRSMLSGRVMSPAGSTDGYKLVKEGDFIISLRSFQGGIEYSRYRGLISPAYTVLRPVKQIHADFYRHFFKSYVFIEKYLSAAVIGIRDGKQISVPDFMNVIIPYPELDWQRKIANVLNAARHEIDILKQRAEAYRKQKRGLMQKLLTGEWRVKTAKEGS